MMNFQNILSLTNVWCSFSLDRNGIVLEFLLVWWISTVFHDWPTSYVLFSSSKLDHFRIFLMMMNFNNILALRNVLCSVSLHRHVMISEFLSPRWISEYVIIDQRRMFLSLGQNEITLEFLWSWWTSVLCDYWLTSYVLFLFIKMTSFENFS